MMWTFFYTPTVELWTLIRGGSYWYFNTRQSLLEFGFSAGIFTPQEIKEIEDEQID